MAGRLRRVAFGVAGLLAGGAAQLSGQAVADVQIAPPNVNVAVGARTSVFATAYAANGNVVPVATLRWVVSNPAVVRVEVDPAAPDVAVLVGLGPGSAVVEAFAGPRRGVATVTVSGAGAPVVSTQPQSVNTPTGGSGGIALLKVNPAAVYMLPAEAATLVPEFYRADGSLAPPMPVTWKSLNTVASVDQNGQVVAISAGQGLIEAAGPSGLVARVPVQISNAGIAVVRRSQGGMMSPGLADTMAVVVPDQQNRRIPPTALQWRSTDETVARVSPFGVVTAINSGRADVVITGFLQEVRAPVTVHRAVELLSMSPPARDTVRISLGASMRFIAQPQAADGSAIPEAQVRYQLLDTMVVSFDANSGIATPKRLGVTKVRVSVAGAIGVDTAWTVSVIAGSIGLSAHRVGLAPGERVRIGASFVDETGRPFGTAAGLRWSSSLPAVASVDNDGNVAAVAMGSALITATTTWGKADTVRVFVQHELLVVSTRLGSSDIYALSRSNPTNFNRLTIDPASDISASFSPDGSTIAFVSTRSPDRNQDVFVMDADGQNVRKLTNTAAGEDTPRWTPDGRHIVYVSNATGQYQVWIMTAEGTEAKRLTEGPAFNSQPAVSPDGKTIAFTSTRDNNYEIYLMDITGANQRNFTKSPGLEQFAGWFPDGKLAYVREQKMGTQRNAPTMRIVMRADVNGGTPAAATPGDVNVSEYAISREGDLIGVISSTVARGGFFTSRLILLSTTPGGPRTDVPPENPQEQVFAPSFRR